METARLYISHNSALFFWRTNPPQYILDDLDTNIRALRGCPSRKEQVDKFALSEAEFGSFPIDVLVPEDGPRPCSVLKYHPQRHQLPAHSLLPLRDGIFVSSPSLCFVHLCTQLSFVEAAELGMELCGTYALRPSEGLFSRPYQLERAALLLSKSRKWQNMDGIKLARRVAQYIADGSASPMESKLYLLLSLPQKYGGYNLPKPKLNATLDLPVRERTVLRQEAVRPDFLWPERKLVVEYDGGYHDDQAQTIKDEKRRVVLETMGYTVVALKKQHVYDPLAFDEVAKMLARKFERRIKPLSVPQQIARGNLRASLLH